MKHGAKAMIQICFVCLGNICRSPTAEAVMQKLITDANLGADITVDSAGIAGYHAGENADTRTRQTAMTFGFHIDQRARQFAPEDLDRFDYVIAMDRSNLKALERLSSLKHHRSKLYLLRHFDPEAGQDIDVPDPYYGGDDGFRHVLDICIRSCQGLLTHLRTTHDL
jgi:protein-tyrosine phosphatase